MYSKRIVKQSGRHLLSYGMGIVGDREGLWEVFSDDTDKDTKWQSKIRYFFMFNTKDGVIFNSGFETISELITFFKRSTSVIDLYRDIDALENIINKKINKKEKI
ncbi:MAG: hypothetical protein ACRCX2_13640 [Paraclostridium sp.]